MKRNTRFNLLMILVLVLATFASLSTGLSGGISMARQAQAQGPGPQGTALGSAFTYQGRLTDTAGVPVPGPCNLRFTLYESATGADQVGTPQTKSGVALSDGYFSALLDFGATAFTGEGRFLKIEVDCGSGYTALSPRVILSPAPYALALPGLWTQQNATSPNVIGGYSGNQVTAGKYGATIGGGGESGWINRVTGDYGTVGGGIRNTTGSDYATVGGGIRNTAGDSAATVGGGAGNTADYYATVGGGGSNTAGGNYATVGGGDSNTADYYATVGGGGSNTAGDIYATVSGGWSNTASGEDATVGGGAENTASGDRATVPGGMQAHASLYGQLAYAGGQFANPGDAQASLYVMRKQTTSSAAWENLYLDGSSVLLTIAPTRTLTFDILVVGRSDAGESAGYYIWGVAENFGGTTTVWATTMILHEDDVNWDAQATGIFGDHLAVQVMGNGETIRWAATVRTAEVAW